MPPPCPGCHRPAPAGVAYAPWVRRLEWSRWAWGGHDGVGVVTAGRGSKRATRPPRGPPKIQASKHGGRLTTRHSERSRRSNAEALPLLLLTVVVTAAALGMFSKAAVARKDAGDATVRYSQGCGGTSGRAGVPSLIPRVRPSLWYQPGFNSHATSSGRHQREAALRAWTPAASCVDRGDSHFQLQY